MNIAIIAAAGQGTRMGQRRAKQFLELAGTPIIIHTLQRFEQCPHIQETVVVLPAQDVAGFLAIAGKHGLRKLARVIPGGASRMESVWRGLQAIRPQTAEVIAVHDGVRPFVTPEEIERTVAAAEEHGAAVLCAPASDTIKEIQDGRVVRTLERARLGHALTPQCFRYALLRRAYEAALARGLEATDCSSLVEALGETVIVVEGSARNIKITRPEDIAFGEILLRQEAEARSQKPE
ncbi:MAG: 2-C-methyl-D-erythritol 4-phosphate cytidylyltransferase [Acidobacteria bacterium]|nr:2-C-methyl-D-erythritol 4-phosphate cytidylyltransferase [Acidobacteriota bacterium]